MKTLYESILNIDDNEKNFDEGIKDQIVQFIKDNFKVHATYKISKNPNKDGKYEVSSIGNIEVKNKKITSLTNNLFIWTEIGGYFGCYNCDSLTSLKGAPKKVSSFDCGRCASLTSLEGAPKKVGNFDCSFCHSLKTLKGAPIEVDGGFRCDHCHSLISLEGTPKEVGWYFSCYNCISLKTLKGAPKEVGADFNCKECNSLTSLEGAPKEVDGDFICTKQFTEEDIKKVSDIKGHIYY